MSPIRFAEANIVMKRPANMTEEECADVHAYRADGQVITAWRPTPEELVKMNLGEPVWLYVIGSTMPPVLVTMENPFAVATEGPNI